MLIVPWLLMVPVQNKPVMKDFMGLNVHTVLFNPDLYRPTTSVVRDYHGIGWDLGDTPDNSAIFPMTRNGVNWLDLYGGWKSKGYRIDVTAQFDGLAPAKWNSTNEFAYGLAFSKFFGPSSEHPLVESVEIGNEPAEFSEAQYRTMFENMAKGIRKGDARLKIATCAVALGKADKYSKDIACLEGLEPLIDIVNVHTYPFVEGWPTWRRSYPEDPKINYLKQAQEMIDWRNKHLPGKPVWVTEFGYDSTTKPNKPTGDFAKWVAVTDEQQAAYIVRSYLMFSSMDIERAYLYWFNDTDEPQLHGSSGLTRNYQPKPSFYAVSHLYGTIGDFAFDKAISRKADEAFVFQYRNPKKPKSILWVAWSPTGSSRTATVSIPRSPSRPVRSAEMPLAAGEAKAATWKRSADGTLSVGISERPVYLWFE